MFSSRSICRSCHATISKRIRQQSDSSLSRYASQQFSHYSSTSRFSINKHGHISHTLGAIRISPLRSSKSTTPSLSIYSSVLNGQIRFASTTNASAIPASPSDLVDTSPNLVDPTSGLPTDWGENFGEALISDHWCIGYLQSNGIHWKWPGPSNSIAWLFEHLHVYFSIPMGLSIGASIAMTAFTLRVIVFPLVVAAAEQGARLRALTSVTAPLQQKLKETRGTGDTQKLAKLSAEYRQALKDANIKLSRTALPLLQIPLGFGAWRVVRGMCDVPVEGLTTGGWLWFKNLAVADPYTGLPLIMSAAQFVAIKLGGETGAQNTQTKKLRMFMQYGLPSISYLIVMWAPAGIQLSFCTASIFALITTVLLRRPSFRRFLKLTPLVKQPTTSVTSGYRGTITVDAHVSSTGVSSAIAQKQPVSLVGKAKQKVTNAFSDVMPEALQKKKESQKKRVNQRAKKYHEKREKELLDEQKRYREDRERRLRERK